MCRQNQRKIKYLQRATGHLLKLQHSCRYILVLSDGVKLVLSDSSSCILVSYLFRYTTDHQLFRPHSDTVSNTSLLLLSLSATLPVISLCTVRPPMASMWCIGKQKNHKLKCKLKQNTLRF